jgi:hypothetical protein
VLRLHGGVESTISRAAQAALIRGPYRGRVRVRRFTRSELAAHWVLALSVLTMIATGLALGINIYHSAVFPIHVGSVFALAAGLAAARYAMTRTPGWLGVGGLALAALAVLGGLWRQDDRERARRESLPLVVVAADVTLRRGNADSYPPRFDARLPRGVEARELGRRGGWAQVELAGGAAGWLPEAAVIPVPR